MIKFLRTLTLAAALVVPVAAQAQLGTAVVNITSHPFNVSNGGGFRANITLTPFDVSIPPSNLTQYIAWCIDDDRSITVPGTYTYSVYSFAGFAAAGLEPVNAASMNRIASLLDPMQAAANDAPLPPFPAASFVGNQAAIWSNFDGNMAAGNSSYDSGAWYVLFNDRNQTLATQLPEPFIVPEPASLALLGMGLAGFAVVARRRRSV